MNICDLNTITLKMFDSKKVWRNAIRGLQFELTDTSLYTVYIYAFAGPNATARCKLNERWNAWRTKT